MHRKKKPGDGISETLNFNFPRSIFIICTISLDPWHDFTWIYYRRALWLINTTYDIFARVSRTLTGKLITSFNRIIDRFIGASSVPATDYNWSHFTIVARN